MFTEERQSKIEQCILERGSVSVQELSTLFNVSEVTIRKDLDELQKGEVVRRTHGGAVARYHSHQRDRYVSLADKRYREKGLIAAKALEYLEDGDAILMDGSSTVNRLASLVAASTLHSLTVITTSVVTAQILNNERVKVIMLGGDLDERMNSVHGPITEAQLADLNVDKGFVGLNGIHRRFGLSTDSFEEAAVKQAILAASKETFVLADHTKFNKKYLSRIARWGEGVDYLITDFNSSIDYAPYEQQVELVCV